MNTQATELIRCMRTTPCSARGLMSILPGLHRLRVACLRDRDRDTLLLLAQHVLDWVDQAASTVRAQGCLEVAELLAEDLGHSETPARLYEIAIALNPRDFNVTDRARRVLEGSELDHRVEWLFVLQARTLDKLRRVEPTIRRAAWRRVSELRMSCGALDGAIAAIDLAAQIEPCAEDVHTLASLLEQRGTPEDNLDAADLYVLMAELAPGQQQLRYLERALALNPEQKVAKAALTVLGSPRPREADISGHVPVAIPWTPPIVKRMDSPRISEAGEHSPKAPKMHLGSLRTRTLLVAAVMFGAAAFVMLHSPMVLLPPSTKGAATRASAQRGARGAAGPAAQNKCSWEASNPPSHGEILPSVTVAASKEPEPLQASLADAGTPVATKEAAAGELGFVAHVRSVQGGRMRPRSLKRALTRTLEEADICYAEKAGTSLSNLELSLTWLVNKAGRVSWVRHKNRRHAVATRCVSKALEAAQFPRPQGGAARIEGTWSLSPQEPS